MLAEPHRTEVPREAIETIVNWMTPELPASHPDDIDGGRRRLLCTEMHLPQQSIREQVLTVDGLPALFGILAEPAGQQSTGELPLVVVLNAGASYRVGPHRLNVQLARELAAQGFRCLRLDLAGLGDSIADDRDLENDPYSATMFRDIDHVLKHAQTELGQQQVVLVGLCSGAYAAFQSAAQFTNPALVESLLINPLTFFWKEGMSIESPEAAAITERHYYLLAAIRPGNWWRLITGRTQIGLSGAAALVTGHLLRRLRPRQAASIASWSPGHDGKVRHPEHDDLPGDLRRAVAAGRHLAFFFSASDPGYPLLKFRAWRVLKALRRSGKVRCEFFENADHTFSRRQPRQSLIQAIIRHLKSRCQAPAGQRR
jgi:pimeloyl-ACP methyl ester carboxylesterase